MYEEMYILRQVTVTYFHFSEATLELILSAIANYPQKEVFPFFTCKSTLYHVV
jgi:hypothetical protein